MSNDRQVTYTLKLQADPGNAAVSSKLQQQLNQQQAHENRFARQSAQDYTAADRAAKQFEATEDRLARKVTSGSRVQNGRRRQEGSLVGSLIADSQEVARSTSELNRHAAAIDRVSASASALSRARRRAMVEDDDPVVNPLARSRRRLHDVNAERSARFHFGNMADALGVISNAELADRASRRTGFSAGLGGIADAANNYRTSRGEIEQDYAKQLYGNNGWNRRGLNQFGIPTTGWGRQMSAAGWFGAPGIAGIGAKLGLGGAGTAGLVGGSIGLGGLLGGLSLAQHYNNYDGPGSIPSGTGGLINGFGGVVGSTSAYLQRSFGMLGKNETPGQVGALPGWARAIPGLETLRHAANSQFAGEGADRSERNALARAQQQAEINRNASRDLGFSRQYDDFGIGQRSQASFGLDFNRDPGRFMSDIGRRRREIGNGAGERAGFASIGTITDGNVEQALDKIQKYTSFLERDNQLVKEHGSAWNTVVGQMEAMQGRIDGTAQGLMGMSQFQRNELFASSGKDLASLSDRQFNQLGSFRDIAGEEWKKKYDANREQRLGPGFKEFQANIGTDAERQRIIAEATKAGEKVPEDLKSVFDAFAAGIKITPDVFKDAIGKFNDTINASLKGIIDQQMEVLRKMQEASRKQEEMQRNANLKQFNGGMPRQ